MKKALYILTFCIAVLALLLDIQNNHYYIIAVSLTTACILLITAIYGDTENQKYLRYITFGFICCFIADLFPFFSHNFVWEMTFYILAKALFAEAFRSYGSLKLNYKIVGVLALFGLSVFIYLSSALGEFLVPAGLYLGMMLYMSWAGIALHKTGKLKNSKWVLFAIILWFVCELLSALDRYGLNSILVGLFVHISYWTALAFIGFSAISSFSFSSKKCTTYENLFSQKVDLNSMN